MSQCRSCKAFLPSAAKFCLDCGRATAQDVPVPADMEGIEEALEATERPSDGRAGRKLKAQGSHAEAPAKKMQGIEDERFEEAMDWNGKEERGEEDEDMKQMMKQMMGMMGKMSQDMKAVTSGVEEAKAKAQEAVDIAKKTEKASMI